MAMEMALRVSGTVRPSSCSSSRPSYCSSCLCKPPIPNSKPHRAPPTSSVSLPTSISLFALITTPTHEARALSLANKDQIVSSLTQVETTIDQVQEVGSSFLDSARHIFEIVVNTLKPGFEVALPIVQKGSEQAFNIASPLLSEASKTAQQAIQSTGFDTAPVFTAAKTAADAAQQTKKVFEVAKPIASSTVEIISSAEPIVIVGTAGALFLTYLVLPPIWSAISFNLRGYQGELTPAQTLDLMSTKNHLMIDIRSEKDKNKAGIPRLPSSAKSRMIAIPLEELPSNLKGIVRNSKKVEAEIAALKISYLKRISKVSKIVIMDSYSDSAKIVARALTNLGFTNCWIVADGFSGGNGWLQSRLGTDSYNLSFAEIVSPSRVIAPAIRRFGTTTTKFLPGSK